MSASAEREAALDRAEAALPIEKIESSRIFQVSGMPIVDAVMKDAGLSNDGITGMANALSGMLKRAEPQA